MSFSYLVLTFCDYFIFLLWDQRLKGEQSLIYINQTLNITPNKDWFCFVSVLKYSAACEHVCHCNFMILQSKFVVYFWICPSQKRNSNVWHFIEWMSAISNEHRVKRSISVGDTTFLTFKFWLNGTDANFCAPSNVFSLNRNVSFWKFS